MQKASFTIVVFGNRTVSFPYPFIYDMKGKAVPAIPFESYGRVIDSFNQNHLPMGYPSVQTNFM